MKYKSYPLKNYSQTKAEIGYVPRKRSTQETYDRIGFMSGLEVHQQLDTGKKLFCRCPAGIYQKDDDYDAEIIRHMRPTLSELGEYDGTALMEFKTRKDIIYRIKNITTCTYDTDDTPPFPINHDALEIALEISLLKKLNIVGEVHITRKQYLDGSIPTGFQRTGILGVEGEIELTNKKIRLIQLSLEEDSCREVSDIGHTRTYRTDRLGMPLIETVTYPDMVNPDEVAEACQFIRFLNRSTGKVRTGIGAARQDVNVSCRGGTRVEIKGVSHIKWIPELTHNEAFRQWALLHIREKLLKKIKKTTEWTIKFKELDSRYFNIKKSPFIKFIKSDYKFYVVLLPGFKGILSHFTQPGKSFADEISDRLKVIACIEQPNMTHSEALKPMISDQVMASIKEEMDMKPADGLVVFRGPEDDIKTSLETIEERCKWAFEGVPNETRKSFADGTTIFERVLPGPDRMYPDTDSAPIPLKDDYIEKLRKRLPEETIKAYRQMKKWNIPEDTYTYILRNNLYPLISKIINKLGYEPKFVGTLFGHKLKYLDRQFEQSKDFNYDKIFSLLENIKNNGYEKELVFEMLPVVYQKPKIDFLSILALINYKKISEKQLLADLSFLKKKHSDICHSNNSEARYNWLMGQIRPKAIGNISLAKLKETVRNIDS